MSVKGKLRLVKVVVQPVFVLDDGEEIIEVEHPAVNVPAGDWDRYSSQTFPQEVVAWQSRLDADAIGGDT